MISWGGAATRLRSEVFPTVPFRRPVSLQPPLSWTLNSLGFIKLSTLQQSGAEAPSTRPCEGQEWREYWFGDRNRGIWKSHLSPLFPARHLSLFKHLFHVCAAPPMNFPSDAVEVEVTTRTITCCLTWNRWNSGFRGACTYLPPQIPPW